MRAPVSTMQAPVFGGFMRVVSKRGHVTHGPASILQAPVFGGFMRVVIGRGYETHGPTPEGNFFFPFIQRYLYSKEDPLV